MTTFMLPAHGHFDGDGCVFPTPGHMAGASCPFGWTKNDLLQLLGPERAERFEQWMHGQTRAICDGFTYNHVLRCHELSGCDPEHGVVTYSIDVRRFLDGGPIVD